MTSGPTLIPPLLLALDGPTIKILFFLAFLLIGGLGKILEEVGKATARRREAAKRAEREQATYTSPTREEPRTGPMNQAELEERLRKMLGRDPPQQNRTSTPVPPVTTNSQRPIVPSPASVATKRARKEAKRKAARAAEIGAQEARVAESIVRKARRAAARRDPGAPIRAMLRGGKDSVRNAFLLSEVLNRKY